MPQISHEQENNKTSSRMPACLMVINFALLKPEERARGMHLFFLMTRSYSREVRYLILTVCHSEIHHFDELVLSISSKSGGKNGTHCWVPEVSRRASLLFHMHRHSFLSTSLVDNSVRFIRQRPCCKSNNLPWFLPHHSSVF